MCCLSFPFKWSKTRGGFREEWLGMETEYVGYKLGLSKQRATWLVDWLRAQVREGRVGLCGHCARLGETIPRTSLRMVFRHPRQAWAAHLAHDAQGLDEVVADRLEGPESMCYERQTLSFFTDAKAENGRAWIGGSWSSCRDAKVLGSRCKSLESGLPGHLRRRTPTR